MKNKKQNGIDWFINHLIKCGHNLSAHKLEIQQAKQMHKEEIEDAWINGMKEQMIAPFAMNRYKPEAEQYYTKTFGGESFQSNGTNHLSSINPLTDKITNGGDNE